MVVIVLRWYPETAHRELEDLNPRTPPTGPLTGRSRSGLDGVRHPPVADGHREKEDPHGLRHWRRLILILVILAIIYFAKRV